MKIEMKKDMTTSCLVSSSFSTMFSKELVRVDQSKIDQWLGLKVIDSIKRLTFITQLFWKPKTTSKTLIKMVILLNTYRML